MELKQLTTGNKEVSYAVKERAEVDEDPEWLDVEQGLGISVLKTLAARWNRQAVFANKHQGCEETEIEDGKAMLVNDDI